MEQINENLNKELIFEKITNSLLETEESFDDFFYYYLIHIPNGVFLLNGPLGSGKTFFVKKMVEGFSVKFGLDKDLLPNSPSFSLINEYKFSNHFFVYHLDLYRINNLKELMNTGFEDIMLYNKGFVFIEWPNKVDISSFLPLSYYEFNIDFNNNGNGRKIEIYKISN